MGKNGRIDSVPRWMLAPVAHGTAAIGVAAACAAANMVNASASVGDIHLIKILYTIYDAHANGSETL